MGQGEQGQTPCIAWLLNQHEVHARDSPPARSPTPSQAERAEREAKLRAQAAALVASHDPAAITAERHHWLVFSVPETPVAGAPCVVYFNKKQSEPLRWGGLVPVRP
jgi:hypothetical protein